MKKLIFLLSLAPLSLLAQKPKSDTSYLKWTPDTYKWNTATGSIVGSAVTQGTMHFTNDMKFVGIPMQKQTVKIIDHDKLLAEVDTASNLHVYGDTTAVLKALIRSFQIKVN